MHELPRILLAFRSKVPFPHFLNHCVCCLAAAAVAAVAAEVG
jgi:hypothetical protein